MPVYNALPYLRLAVESVLVQSFADFNLIAVDDGSADGSLALLNEMAKEDARISVISQSNGGIVAALNAGLARVDSPYVARMDADDIARPGRLAMQYEYMQNHSEVALLGSAVQMIDPVGRPLKVVDVPVEHDAILKILLRGGASAFFHPAVMFRTEAIREIDGYRQQYRHVEDLDLYLRLAQQHQLANLPEVLLDYRLHLQSINHQQASLQLKLAEELVQHFQKAYGVDKGGDDNAFRGRRSSTEFEQKLDWIYLALDGGNIKTARALCFSLLRACPLRWKTYVALRRVMF
jgi:glycosyltransferase involved in cell wall biosynthesis